MKRAPIIAILGHVDHGKTTLLDHIRKSNITQKEKGGITQKIGAYEINYQAENFPESKITFIDTPGHEIFSLLRAKGAQVADIAILLIDAKESIKPQTIESIAHIKEAKIPFIVALNKTDLPEAQPEKIKDQLIKYDVVVEDRGGKVPVINISAKTGQGVNDLLETLLLLASELNLQFNPKNPPLGYVIEVKKDKRGIVASVILKDGSIKIGDTLFCGEQKFDLRAIINDQGKNLSLLTPSTPAEILGLKEMTTLGSLISSKPTQSTTFFPKEKTVKEVRLEDLLNKKEERKIKIILKTDNFGSLKAIESVLQKNQNIEIILSSIGEIAKSDVFLAKTAKAIIIGFNSFPNQEVKQLANEEKIPIRVYDIIYQLIDELNETTQFLKKIEEEKKYKGEAKILALFNIENEVVAGIKMLKGKANLNDQVEVYRSGNLIGKGRLTSLKIRAKPVNEVRKNEEAGMIFSPRLDITIGDVIKFIL